MRVFSGESPTALYYNAMNTILTDGWEVAPRGKKVKELLGAAVEFQNPLNRVTFLGGRRVNPFFQIAESLWILSGRADVAWLLKFNANMGQFSDDGIWFNAPYGERIRTWNKNSAHDIIINPIDQMQDAFLKMSADYDTRQATIIISNPMFDNSRYTIGEKGKDIACNLAITFKIRFGKLYMMVVNRSNDLHWGLMGANLCQFSTIQETMAAWLGVEVGSYTQVTDSLHIYTDDYGFKCTQDVQEYYELHEHSREGINDLNFVCHDEPRMDMTKEQFDKFLGLFWGTINEYLMSDDFIDSDEVPNIIKYIDTCADPDQSETYIDPYWRYGLKSMFAYRMVKQGHTLAALEKVISTLPACQWKVSQLYFLQSFINKLPDDERTKANDLYYAQVENIEENLIVQTDDNVGYLNEYLLGAVEGVC